MGWEVDTDVAASVGANPIGNFSDFLVQGNSIDALMANYGDFAFAVGTKHYQSPFWRAYRQIRKVLDTSVDGIEASVLWTNIFRMDFKGGSVWANSTRDEFSAIQKCGRGLLSKEIRILQPDFMVFFTGPNYNSELEQEFIGLSYTKINTHDVSRSAWLSHPVFHEAKVVRTYHPRYLQTSKQWKVLDKIVQTIKNGN